jgi:hypothetical protein
MLSSALRRNTVANALGRAAGVLIQRAMVPVYLRWLGLDGGMSGTVDRELARSGDAAARGWPPASGRCRCALRFVGTRMPCS